jgi:cytochrome c oxidase subunit 4
VRREVRHILLAWSALIVLLALTCASSWWAIGAWNSVINLGIAGAKAAIVAFVFMHVGASGAVRACVGVALFVLLLIFALGGSDYATRDLHPAAWQPPPGVTPGSDHQDGTVD